MTRWSVFLLGFKNYAVVTIVVLMVLSGCKQDDPIAKQRVPKSRSGLEALRDPSPLGNETAPIPAVEKTDRMVVAIYETDDATWFFKLNGSAEQVGKTETEWKPFFESITFADSQPTWELPAGWTEGGDRPMRFATLTIGEVTPPLEMAISSLGPGQDLLLNVNRWRGQMGLGPISDQELSTNTQPLKSEIKTAVLFDVAGKASGSMMGAPFANRGGGLNPPIAGPSINPTPNDQSNSNSNQKSTSAAESSGIKFDTPAGWELGPVSGMVPVRLQKTSGDKSAQISVIPLPAAANEWDPNVTRWADQVEMGGLTQAELASLTQKVSVAGLEGQLVKLIPAGDEKQTATIAGMVKQNETAWFLKLSGDKTIVSENEDEFMDFLKSLKFPAPQ